jgi:hypothetical protein
MTMNAGTLATAMTAAVLAATAGYDGDEADDHRLPAYTRTDYWTKVCTAISQTVVAHIQSNAVCDGLDSHGDSHGSVGVQ